MGRHVCVCLSVCLSACLPACLPACQSHAVPRRATPRRASWLAWHNNNNTVNANTERQGTFSSPVAELITASWHSQKLSETVKSETVVRLVVHSYNCIHHTSYITSTVTNVHSYTELFLVKINDFLTDTVFTSILLWLLSHQQMKGNNRRRPQTKNLPKTRDQSYSNTIKNNIGSHIILNIQVMVYWGSHIITSYWP